MTTEIAEKLYTVEEYFDFEKKSEIRHEFYYGELIPMPGESTTANDIASNILVFFKLFLKGKPFKVYEHDIKLMVKDQKVYRYPDLFVIHQKGNHKTYTTDPVLIVEVISDSTENTDRERKRVQYFSIPTLQYYLLVHQDESIVEFYTRENSHWIYDYRSDLNDTIALPFFETSISLSTIYDGITLEKENQD